MINIWLRIRIMMKIWNLNKLMLQRKSSDEGELSTAGWKSKADAKAENDNNCDLVYLTISTFYISSSSIDMNKCDLVNLTISTFYISSSDIDISIYDNVIWCIWQCQLFTFHQLILIPVTWYIWQYQLFTFHQAMLIRTTVI